MPRTFLSSEVGLGADALAEYLLTSFDIGVAVYDGSGIVASNEMACELLGVPEQGLDRIDTGDDRWACIHPNGEPIPSAEIPAARVLRTGCTVHAEIVGLRRRDDSVRWLKVSALPIHDDAGSVRAALVTFSDVTEVKTVARQLDQADMRFRNWFEDGLSANLVVDVAGGVVAWNRTAAALLERCDADLFDLTCSDLMVLDLRATAAMLCDGTTDSVEGFTHIVTSDGTEIEVEARVVSIEWPGHAGCMMIQMTRHSDSATGGEVEDWHRSAFEHAVTPMVLLSSGARVVRANRSCAELVGENSIDLIGRPLASMVTLGDATVHDICDLIRMRRPMVDINQAILHTATGLHPVAVRFSRVADHSVHVLAQLIDRTPTTAA